MSLEQESIWRFRISNRFKTYLFDGVQGQRYHIEWQLHLREVRNGLRRNEISRNYNLWKKNKLNLQRLAAFTKTARDPVVLIGKVELYVIKHMKVDRKVSKKKGEVKCLAQEHNVPGVPGQGSNPDRTIRRRAR